jgi:hypothetical protein
LMPRWSMVHAIWSSRCVVGMKEVSMTIKIRPPSHNH